ncbi:MAG TPA: DUF697 domain-containing protein [Thermoanaerobaculia bacterium]|nr:DUF697 domain-containing protein [Thermoanaerobaculia bacterium]
MPNRAADSAPIITEHPADAAPILSEDRTAGAVQIIKKYALWSAGAGLIPVPGVDLAAIAGVQVKMLSELARLYDVPFRRNRAKAVILGVLGSTGAQALAVGLPGTAVKMVPILGSVIGAVTTPLFAGAVTYGIGNVLVPHFERGGTLENLNPTSPDVQRAYREGFDRGRRDIDARPVTA